MPVCFVRVPSSFAMPPSRGNPESGITPPSFACFAHPHLCLHRSLNELSDHRNVAEAPFPLSLPWHPFHSAMVTKCFITCSCQHFHKNCIKLAYVIRIMISTFKMFKNVVCFKLLSDMGIFRNYRLLFPASFKLA